MSRYCQLILVAAVLLAAPHTAASSNAGDEAGERESESSGPTYNEPNRDGFTAQFGFGLSYVFDQPPHTSSSHGLGIWPGSLAIGFFLHPDAALLANFSGSSYISEIDDDLAQVTATYAGIELQWWPTDEFTVGAGGGASWYAAGNADHLDVDRIDELSRSGWALSLRGGYAFGVWESTALRFNLEVLPAFYAGDLTLGTNLGFEVQTF